MGATQHFLRDLPLDKIIFDPAADVAWPSKISSFANAVPLSNLSFVRAEFMSCN